MAITMTTALCIPAPEVIALTQGQTILAWSQSFLSSGESLALCPVNHLPIQASTDVCYQYPLLSVAQALDLLAPLAVIPAWAKVDFCRIYRDDSQLEAIANHTVWTTEFLETLRTERGKIFLIGLRVYKLAQPVSVPDSNLSASKLGRFIRLSPSITVNEDQPVLDAEKFAYKQQQILNPEQPIFVSESSATVEIVEKSLIDQVYDLVTTGKDPELCQQLKMVLGCGDQAPVTNQEDDLSWINTIAALGDRSIEKDEGKSNYQAGTEFENIVHKSLEFLGFTIEEAHHGGAGGLDLFCSSPYPVVGECKAGRKIPDNTAEQLYRIGTRHLGDNYATTTKIIIGPGEPTSYLQDSAQQGKISIVNAKALEKLVRMQAIYPGSINLWEFKDQVLKPGQVDDQVDTYIDAVKYEIKLRSDIVTTIKNRIAQIQCDTVGKEECRFVYEALYPSQTIRPEKFEHILFELSSPLLGYLGYFKDDNDTDRFYFLRDLVVEDI